MAKAAATSKRKSKPSRTASRKATTARKSARPAKKRRKPAPRPPANDPPGPPGRELASAGAMTAPASGVKVRMYRQGHGDCFLLAFPGSHGRAVYVLIDCGYKPGSNSHTFGLSKIDDIVASILEATNGHLDLVVITHEHQDHVNSLWKKNEPYFDRFTVGAAWLAWTEDPEDDLANELRRRHHDQLLGLVAARNQLAANNKAVAMLDELLSLELGVDAPGQFATAAAEKKDPKKSINKQGIRLIKDKATAKNTRYILPHKEIMSIPSVEGVRIFAFGPPHSADLIKDEDPQGSEAFPGKAISAYSSFFAAARGASGGDEQKLLPFSRRFSVPLKDAFRHAEYGEFFRKQYGEGAGSKDGDRSPDDAPWRRIDQDWLNSAEELALVLNRGINNTSLVLAFELQKSKKVLLFVGDAQRGNWISWTKGGWKDGEHTITVRDLMSRTVLYKVGHHGSHNATLNGTVESDYPNLAWMGHGRYGTEFTAMITAVREWAYTMQDPPWRHPLKSIKNALLAKANGRVFQTDTPQLTPPSNGANPDWQDFLRRTYVDPRGLYFEYEVHD